MRYIVVVVMSCLLALSNASFVLAKDSVGRVQDLRVVSTTNRQVELKWDRVSSADAYQIRVMRKTGGLYKLVKKKRTTAKTESVSGLQPNHTYYFRVRASRDGDYGVYSERLKLRTTVDQVTNVSVTETATDSMTLTWDAVTGAERYQVRVMTLDGDTYALNTKKTTIDTTLTIGELVANQNYYIKVRAKRSTAYGPYSSVISASTDAAVPFWNEGADLPGAAQAAVSGTLNTENSAGRTGSYYLPVGYNTETKPLLILYHGTNGNGAEILNWFVAYAAANDFIIVAPDSRMSPSGDYIWEVGTTDGEITEDYTHTLDCISEVDTIAGVTFDPNHVMTAGFSAGGSSAPYLATNDLRFTHYAILHGGVFTEGLGDNVIPGWLSTGETDTLRTPDMYEVYYDNLVSAGFTDLTYRVYDEGHEVNSDERGELINWWLF